jgi:tetratricopeptide (TPR) repeat protein
MKVVAHSLFVGAMTAWRAVAFATVAIALSLGQGLWAQGPLTLEAIALADSGNLSEAENVLNGALSGPESGDAMTWYVHAFVLKERYVEGGSQPASLQRTKALESLRECIRRDPQNRLEDWWRPLLLFLGEGYLLDVQVEIRNIAPGQPVVAEEYFSQYAAIQKDLNPRADTATEWVLMQQQLGETAMTEAKALEKAGAGPWFELGTHHYTLAAEQNHDQYRSLFNLAVHTYNQGVREFKTAEDDLDAIDTALENASRHWLRASEFLEAAIAKDDTQAEGFEALAIVSTALLNQDRIEWCKAHIQELEGH